MCVYLYPIQFTRFREELDQKIGKNLSTINQHKANDKLKYFIYDLTFPFIENTIHKFLSVHIFHLYFCPIIYPHAKDTITLNIINDKKYNK